MTKLREPKLRPGFCGDVTLREEGTTFTFAWPGCEIRLRLADPCDGDGLEIILSPEFDDKEPPFVELTVPPKLLRPEF